MEGHLHFTLLFKLPKSASLDHSHDNNNDNVQCSCGPRESGCRAQTANKPQNRNGPRHYACFSFLKCNFLILTTKQVKGLNVFKCPRFVKWPHRFNFDWIWTNSISSSALAGSARTRTAPRRPTRPDPPRTTRNGTVLAPKTERLCCEGTRSTKKNGACNSDN